jgi:serine carboxypeptidase-like clade 2
MLYRQVTCCDRRMLVMTTLVVWHMCSPVVSYNYQDVLSSVIPDYRYLITTAHADILVYSGDVDAIVPYWGTQAWVVGLQLAVKEKWRAWHVNDTFGEQAGGFVVVYDGLTFATVRNAGHEVSECVWVWCLHLTPDIFYFLKVPFYQPKRAHFMFNGFLTNARLPN